MPVVVFSGVISVFLNAFPNGADEQLIVEYAKPYCKNPSSNHDEEILKVLKGSPQVFQKLDTKWKFVAFSN